MLANLPNVEDAEKPLITTNQRILAAGSYLRICELSSESRSTPSATLILRSQMTCIRPLSLITFSTPLELTVQIRTGEELPAFSYQPSATSLQLPAFSYQPSATSLQLPAFSYQPSVFFLPYSIETQAILEGWESEVLFVSDAGEFRSIAPKSRFKEMRNCLTITLQPLSGMH